MTRVEIQSGADAAPSASLYGVFQLRDCGEARGWCVEPEVEPSSERRGR